MSYLKLLEAVAAQQSITLIEAEDFVRKSMSGTAATSSNVPITGSTNWSSVVTSMIKSVGKFTKQSDVV